MDLEAVKKNKKILIPVAIGAAGYIGWRYYQASKGTGSDAGDTPSDYADDGTIPGVAGAVSPTNSYGDSGNSTDNGNDPDRFTTNAGWTNYARSQLQSAYEDSDIVAALGTSPWSKPLSTEQQTIVRAAIAVAGYPPVGTFSVITGGNTPLTVAPTGVT